MSTPPPSLRHDLGALGAWLVLDTLEFHGTTPMSMLIELGLAGDYDDGTPGWVNWTDLPTSIERVAEALQLTGGVHAALEFAIALASCQRIESLDAPNRAALQWVLRVFADAI